MVCTFEEVLLGIRQGKVTNVSMLAEVAPYCVHIASDVMVGYRSPLVRMKRSERGDSGSAPGLWIVTEHGCTTKRLSPANLSTSIHSIQALPPKPSTSHTTSIESQRGKQTSSQLPSFPTSDHSPQLPSRPASTSAGFYQTLFDPLKPPSGQFSGLMVSTCLQWLRRWCRAVTPASSVPSLQSG